MGLCSQVSNVCFWLLGLETCPDFILRSIGLKILFVSGISKWPSPHLSPASGNTHLSLIPACGKLHTGPTVRLGLPRRGRYRQVLLKYKDESTWIECADGQRGFGSVLPVSLKLAWPLLTNALHKRSASVHFPPMTLCCLQEPAHHVLSFVLFGHTAQLAGTYFPKQGSNLGPQQ